MRAERAENGVKWRETGFGTRETGVSDLDNSGIRKNVEHNVKGHERERAENHVVNMNIIDT